LINYPSESQNLVDELQWQEIRQSLENELMAWFEKYADFQNDGQHARVFGRGQIGKMFYETDQSKAFADDYFFTAKIYKFVAFILRIFGQK
jgi:hypothetical protein